MNELGKRVAFSVVASPTAVAIIYFGGVALVALLAVVSALGAWELFRIARAGGVQTLDVLGIPLAALVPVAVHARRSAPSGAGSAIYSLGWTEAAVIALALLAVSIWARGVNGRPLSAVAVTLFGIAYVGGMLSFGYMIRYHPYAAGDRAGTALIFLPLILTWGTDTGAYAFGRTFGSRKLIPSVSPGKTVEGSLGGLAVAVVACWLYVRFVLQPYAQVGMSLAGIVLFALIVSVAAQVGDLAESLLKREAGVKDSSHIIPGHGGILDRFDSLLFVLPVSYLLFRAVLIPTPG